MTATTTTTPLSVQIIVFAAAFIALAALLAVCYIIVRQESIRWRQWRQQRLQQRQARQKRLSKQGSQSRRLSSTMTMATSHQHASSSSDSSSTTSSTDHDDQILHTSGQFHGLDRSVPNHDFEEVHSDVDTSQFADIENAAMAAATAHPSVLDEVHSDDVAESPGECGAAANPRLNQIQNVTNPEQMQQQEQQTSLSPTCSTMTTTPRWTKAMTTALPLTTKSSLIQTLELLRVDEDHCGPVDVDSCGNNHDDDNDAYPNNNYDEEDGRSVHTNSDVDVLDVSSTASSSSSNSRMVIFDDGDEDFCDTMSSSRSLPLDAAVMHQQSLFVVLPTMPALTLQSIVVAPSHEQLQTNLTSDEAWKEFQDCSSTSAASSSDEPGSAADIMDAWKRPCAKYERRWKIVVNRRTEV